MMWIYAGGIGVTTLITVPNWPFFNRHPPKWLDPSEAEKHPKPEVVGLIVSSRKVSIQHFKQPWAHAYEPVKDLIGAVNAIKPTVLIGTSGVGQTFTKEVVEAMATNNEVSTFTNVIY
ncbi:NAD(P)-binding domain protein [Raphanus sativus]|nr:NAD(P)-binding domain protein [Raphanus sativus]